MEDEIPPVGKRFVLTFTLFCEIAYVVETFAVDSIDQSVKSFTILKDLYV